jgi:hypothetical protein
MTAEVVTDISDVTERMQAAGRGLEGEAFTKARDAEAGRIETQACGGDATRRCQVVTLYRGGQFKLYTYRRYTDVRLAFAPEHRASAFGGDLDNFSFPRFAIDGAFVRIYENGQPVATPNHLRWNPAAPKENQPVFLSGSPGATQRLLTQDQLRTVADVTLPLEQLLNSELRGRLMQFSRQSEQNAFQAQGPLYGIENTYKRGYGRQQALIDARFMAQRQRSEAEFRQRLAPMPSCRGRLAIRGATWRRCRGKCGGSTPLTTCWRPAAGAGRSFTIGLETSCAARRRRPSPVRSAYLNMAMRGFRRSSSACSRSVRSTRRWTRFSWPGGCPRLARS